MPDNPWIDRRLDNNTLIDECYTQLRLPATFTKFRHSVVWTNLRHFNNLTVDDFLTRQQLEVLSKRHDATIETDLYGTELYIGTQASGNLDALLMKLDHLLFSKCKPDPTAAHVFYTEAYKGPADLEMTVDARFMANIDIGLLRTTLFDVGVSTDSALGYHVLANAITLRLCRWDSTKGYHVSFIGPKVKPRKESAAKIGTLPYVLRNRIMHSKPSPKDDATDASEAGAVLTNGKLRQQQKNTVPKLPGTDRPSSDGADVEKWLNTSTSSLPAILEGVLIDLTTTDGAQPTQTPQKEFWADLEGLSIDQVDYTASDTTTTAQRPTEPENGASKPPSVNGSNLGVATPLPTKQYASRTIGKPPARSTSRTSSAGLRSIPSSVAGSTKANSSDISRASKQLGSGISHEIHAAVAKLVEKGPFLRGKVSLRFELGRIIIVGMDYSGLSFNLPGFRSNGWGKSRMLYNLHHAGRNQSLLFTPLLTQDGSDIEFMVKTNNLDLRKPMWKDEATETKIYSFFCYDRRGGRDEYFFIDVEINDREDGLGHKYSLRSKNDDKAPVWIHGLVRNWDARIVMSHVDTHMLEEKFGAFARMIVRAIPLKNMNNLPWFQVRSSSHHPDIVWMRVRTLWRFASVSTGSDDMSYLNITEVKQVEHRMVCCTKKECKCMGVTHEFDLKRTMDAEPSLWYEAFITSHTAEELLLKNETLELGEKGDWDYERLKKSKAIDALYKPGLRMLQIMDSVGAHNNNDRVDALVLPTGNRQEHPEVPGATYVEETPRPHRALDTTTVASVAVPEQIIPTPADEFVQKAFPPGSVRGPVQLAVTTHERRRKSSANRREVAPYRLQTAPTSVARAAAAIPETTTPTVTDHQPLATMPAPLPASQKQENRVPSRSPSAASSAGRTCHQASSRWPAQTFW
jgi:hypothetical protein